MCNPAQEVNNLVGGVSNALTSVGEGINNTFNAIGKTVNAIIANPLPTLEATALTYALGPEGLALTGTGAAATTTAAAIASAAVQYANGNTNVNSLLLNIATSVGASYAANAAGTAAGNISSGGTYSNAATYENSLTGEVTTQSGLSPDEVKLITNVVTSASGPAAITALKGGDFEQVLSAGAAGAVSGAVSTALNQAGVTGASANLIAKATSAATSAIINGTDIGTAIGTSVAATAIQQSISASVASILGKQNNLTDLGKSYSDAADKFTTWYNQNNVGDLVNTLNTGADLQKSLDSFNQQITSYNAGVNLTKTGNTTDADALNAAGVSYIWNSVTTYGDGTQVVTPVYRLPDGTETVGNLSAAMANYLNGIAPNLQSTADNLNTSLNTYNTASTTYNALLPTLNTYTSNLDDLKSQIDDATKSINTDVQNVANNVVDYQNQVTTDLLGQNGIVSQIAGQTVTDVQNGILDNAAQDNGFNDYAQQQAAVLAGFNSTDGSSYKDATGLGFKDFASYADAQKIEPGFNASQYADLQSFASNNGFKDLSSAFQAQTEGFTNATDFSAAKNLGIPDVGTYNIVSALAQNSGSSMQDAFNQFNFIHDTLASADTSDPNIQSDVNKADQLLMGLTSITASKGTSSQEIQDNINALENLNKSIAVLKSGNPDIYVDSVTGIPFIQDKTSLDNMGNPNWVPASFLQTFGTIFGIGGNDASNAAGKFAMVGSAEGSGSGGQGFQLISGGSGTQPGTSNFDFSIVTFSSADQKQAALDYLNKEIQIHLDNPDTTDPVELSNLNTIKSAVEKTAVVDSSNKDSSNKNNYVVDQNSGGQIIKDGQVVDANTGLKLGTPEQNNLTKNDQNQWVDNTGAVVPVVGSTSSTTSTTHILPPEEPPSDNQAPPEDPSAPGQVAPIQVLPTEPPPDNQAPQDPGSPSAPGQNAPTQQTGGSSGGNQNPGPGTSGNTGNQSPGSGISGSSSNQAPGSGGSGGNQSPGSGSTGSSSSQAPGGSSGSNNNTSVSGVPSGSSGSVVGGNSNVSVSGTPSGSSGTVVGGTSNTSVSGTPSGSSGTVSGGTSGTPGGTSGVNGASGNAGTGGGTGGGVTTTNTITITPVVINPTPIVPVTNTTVPALTAAQLAILSTPTIFTPYTPGIIGGATQEDLSGYTIAPISEKEANAENAPTEYVQNIGPQDAAQVTYQSPYDAYNSPYQEENTTMAATGGSVDDLLRLINWRI